MSEEKRFTPVKLASEIEKVKKYHTTMNDIADIVEKVGPQSLQIDRQHAFLQYYISKDSFKNLVDISNQQNFDGFVVFFGMEGKESFNKLTAIIMGADKNQNILNQHKAPYVNLENELSDPLPVDEQNPPPPYSNGSRDIMPSNCFTLNSNWNDVEAFFTNIDPQQVLPEMKQ